ncbi:MAG: ABC transporter ATP-binding protein [Gemmatimonadales bacterium]
MEPPKKKKVSADAAWRESRALLYTYRWRLLLGLVLMLVNRAAGLVLPAIPKWLIDHALKESKPQLLLPLALAALGATVVQATTGFALSQLLGVAAQRAVTDLRRRVAEHVLRLPIRSFDATQTGILISRIMNDAEGVRNLVGTGLVQLVGGVMTAVVAIGVLFYLNWQLTSIIVLLLGAFGGGMAVAFTRLRPLFRERGKIQAEVTGRLTETLGGIRIVKSYVAERREQLTFTRGVHRLFRNVASSMTGISAVGSLTTTIVGLVGALMIMVGGRSIIAGHMTIGDFFVYVLFVGLVAAPLVQIAGIGTQVSEAFAGLDRIRELTSQVTEEDEDKTRLPVGRIEGRVTAEDVWFEYTPGVPVLRDVSFEAPAGTTTALVGSSGSGKSTLLSLVMAFNRPTRGFIRVDGRDLSTLRMREFRSHLGIVLQDNFLFDGTIADNIRFARPDATMDDVRAASKLANCDEFIEAFKDGYQSIVGERGVKLSGGQRQRVAIARAILADPAILILDEATSSLDSESEAMIQDGLRALRRGRTTFVIAHRLSTIVSADQILVLEGGVIVERGTHRELLARRGRYTQLYEKQYRIEIDRFINPGEDFTPEPEAAAAATGPRVTDPASL